MEFVQDEEEDYRDVLQYRLASIDLKPPETDRIKSTPIERGKLTYKLRFGERIPRNTKL
jgi:hypothetical protein